MNLKEKILLEHTKSNCDQIVEWIGSSQKKFDQLFKLFIANEYRISQRAAWPLSHCVIAHPKLIQSHFDELINHLSTPHLHNAIIRNTLRLLQEIDIPEKFHGEIMDRCFKYVASLDEPVAIKAFSLTILNRLSIQYPDIRNELLLLIEERWPYETAAFHSRAKKIIS